MVSYSAGQDSPSDEEDSLSPESVLQIILHNDFRAVSEQNLRLAQEHIYAAWDAEDEDEMSECVMQALELNPRNVDGLLMLLDWTTWTGDPEIDALRRILAFAEEELGKQAFTELVPHFWGCVETRPYMRVRRELGEALLQVGRLPEAAAEFEAMLKLNENDNQGVRYELLTCYLAQGALEEIDALRERFSEEENTSVVFSWGRVLQLHLRNDLKGAVKALESARKQNPHGEGYASGRRRVPRTMPPSYQLGSPDEARCYAHLLNLAWKSHRASRKWLREEGQAK